MSLTTLLVFMSDIKITMGGSLDLYKTTPQGVSGAGGGGGSSGQASGTNSTTGGGGSSGQASGTNSTTGGAGSSQDGTTASHPWSPSNLITHIEGPRPTSHNRAILPKHLENAITSPDVLMDWVKYRGLFDDPDLARHFEITVRCEIMQEAMRNAPELHDNRPFTIRDQARDY